MTASQHSSQAFIEVVTDLQAEDTGTRLLLRNGLRVYLPAEHPDRELILREARRSLQRQEPVGVLVDAAGRVVDLNYTYPVTVHAVQEDDEDPTRWMVLFWGFSPVCYLTKDHPDRERIRATLEEAARLGQPVWLANRLWPAQGETEIWQQILDVRPRHSLPASRDQGESVMGELHGKVLPTIPVTAKEPEPTS
jgi:hypothetical protein